jgi:hypothetical protein
MALAPRQLLAKIVITYAEDSLHIATCYTARYLRRLLALGLSFDGTWTISSA